MRHAAALPHAHDAARPLTPKGQVVAAEAGEFLRPIGVVPDHVMVSPALRCTATWEHVARTLQPGEDTVVSVEHGIYAAAPDSLLTVLRSVPASARTVMMVGHNPSVAYLASVLADTDGPIEVLQHLLNGLLPGALAVYETAMPWSELDMLGACPTHFPQGSTA